MGFVRKTISSFTGADAADAAKEGAEIQAGAGLAAITEQREAAERAQGFFEPFSGVAARGVEASGFLADPQAQFDFLQNNPLFKKALANANRDTEQQAASLGRTSFGSTLEDLSSNVLLAASPLIDRQRQDVGTLLNLGTGIATSQANIETGQAARVGDLTTGIGAARAAGKVGAANARAGGVENLINTGITAAILSDERLKENKQVAGEANGHMWYSWDWNELAGKVFGMFGSEVGVMAQEAMVKAPSAVIMAPDGFYRVNYGEL